MWTDRRAEDGPFDIIGDVHGCHGELTALLRALGYLLDADGTAATPPDGRRAVFLGDFGDRGPDTPRVLELVMSMTEAGSALCVPGNHDVKLVRKLKGRNVQITHGLGATLEQLADRSQAFRERVRDFLDGLVSHLVLDDGRLVVAHAGLKQPYQGRSSARVRDFALYGETTGGTDEFGLPVRLAWAADYRGPAAVVYGHTPVAEAGWLNNTINIDTGCVFGGRLTALRWPERELVSVPASRTYYEPAKPLKAAGDGAPAGDEDRPAFLLDVDDVAGKRIVQTRLARTVTVREENAAAALEVMSRFAADPRWLVYLPPTMAPTATSRRPDLLEHPEEAFAEYRSAGVPRVICEEKHMGSRAIVVVCRDAGVARERFGVDGGETGAIFTRGPLDKAGARGLDVAHLADRQRGRIEHVDRYVEAYRRYVWPVDGVADLRLAPFHILATETGVHVDRDHTWHLELCDRLCAADPDWLRRTGRRAVDVTDLEDQTAATGWWEQLTATGGEGMVVKPMGFVARGRKGLVQPGLKCRGREYLRIVYGPEYADPGQIERLRGRSLGRKRSLAVREFGLGVEALERFVRREPLYRVHECVFGVLALESEPVDPRL